MSTSRFWVTCADRLLQCCLGPVLTVTITVTRMSWWQALSGWTFQLVINEFSVYNMYSIYIYLQEKTQ